MTSRGAVRFYITVLCCINVTFSPSQVWEVIYVISTLLLIYVMQVNSLVWDVSFEHWMSICFGNKLQVSTAFKRVCNMTFVNMSTFLIQVLKI